MYTTSLRGLNVLVVSDNPTARAAFEERLASWCVSPQFANDSITTLQKLRAATADRRSFPIVIVDVDSPATAFGLADQIEGDPDVFPLPTIVLVLPSMDAQLPPPLAGILHVKKPVSPSALQQALVKGMEHFAKFAPAPRRSPQAISAGTFGGPRDVLVVEDVPANQKLIFDVLHKRGHRVTVASNGRDAVELTRHARFDLVLMDIQMPIMDGLQATAAIRKQPAGHDLPIVALTAHASAVDRDQCLAAGMNHHLSKPIDGLELIDIVEHFQDHLHPSEKKTPPTASASSTRGPNSAAPQSSAALPFDLQGSLQRLGNDRTLLADLAKVFIEDSPGLLERIKLGLSDGDCLKVQQSAHALRGLASNFGAEPVTEPLLHLEQQAAAGSLRPVARFEDLEAEIGRLREALTAYC